VVIYQTPHRSATNAAFVDWTATFNEPVMGFDVADVVIGGPAAGAWSLRRIFGQDALYAFTTEQASPSNGTFSIQIAAGSITDLAGNPVGASNMITVTVDRSAPNANGPSVSLGAGTTLSGGALRAGVKLSGTDVGPAGIASYDVARSYDGHAFRLMAASLTGASYGTTLTPGHSYRFEVRARDKAGNLGPWKAGPTVRPALTQQTSSAVHFSGASATSSATSYSGGSERHLLAAGASASYTTTARSLSFITTKGSSRGSARIYVDGVFQTTVNLNAASTTYRFVAFTKTWGAVGTHTIKVVSVGTPAARVDIDAFGVIR
jgi:chitodextrinase